jgi:hypothetical protein
MLLPAGRPQGFCRAADFCAAQARGPFDHKLKPYAGSHKTPFLTMRARRARLLILGFFKAVAPLIWLIDFLR